MYTVYYCTWYGEKVFIYDLSYDQAVEQVERAKRALRRDVTMWEQK